MPHLLLCCDASRPLPLAGRFDTILGFGFLYQFEAYAKLLEEILAAHSEPGTLVYGAEPIRAIGSPYHIERAQFLQLLRRHGSATVYFHEGLIHRLVRKISRPRWLLRTSAEWSIRSPTLMPFAHYMQYVLRVPE